MSVSREKRNSFRDTEKIEREEKMVKIKKESSNLEKETEVWN